MKISSDLVLFSVACVIFKQSARSGIMKILAIVLANCNSLLPIGIKGYLETFQSSEYDTHRMHIPAVYETLCPFASELGKN